MKLFIENEVFDKTKRKGALAEEAARVASGMSRTLASAMAQKAPPPSKQGKTDAKTKVRLLLCLYKEQSDTRPNYPLSMNDFELHQEFIRTSNKRK